MKFEEQFPSLKGKVKQIYNSAKRIFKKGLLPGCVDIKDIQEHCLDKQKVKEIIDSRIKKYKGNKFLRYQNTNTVEARGTHLRRELISAISELEELKEELKLG